MKAIRRLQHKLLSAHLHFISILFLYTVYIVINEQSQTLDIIFFGYLFLNLMISAFLIYKHFFESTVVYVLIRYGFSIGIVFFCHYIHCFSSFSYLDCLTLYFLKLFISIPND